MTVEGRAQVPSSSGNTAAHWEMKEVFPYLQVDVLLASTA